MASDLEIGSNSSREPEDDLSGLYEARLLDLEEVDKPQWRIDSEVTRWGKDPEKVDPKELVWTFEFTDQSWPGDYNDDGKQIMLGYTGRTWGERSNAQRYGRAILGQEIGPGMRASVLIGRPCRLLVGYSEKGRNFIKDVNPPKPEPKSRLAASVGAGKSILDNDDDIPF